MPDLEKIKKGLNYCLRSSIEEHENCPYVEECNKAIALNADKCPLLEDLLYILLRLENSGWISVADQLPENETEVIIIVQHKIGWYRAFAWHDEYGWHSSAEEFGDGESDFVTYWTPLPEPPEEVSGDDRH